MEFPKHYRREKRTEWIRFGDYALAVEIEAGVDPKLPGESLLTPETVRRLEELHALAAAGDLASLRKAGTLFVRQPEPLKQSA